MDILEEDFQNGELCKKLCHILLAVHAQLVNNLNILEKCVYTIAFFVERWSMI